MRKNNKILSQNSVFELAYNLRKQGKVIGFTHGEFDLFNISHLDLLKKSKELCDFLIVGIDSDLSIKKQKRNLQPIINEKSRVDIIKSLGFVNAVFIKDAYYQPCDEAKDLYKEINPNFITIGQSFANEDLIKSLISKTDIDLKKLNVFQMVITD
ncbi:MAG TPA: adenylyltransferase/cytidyltransferase family protein [Candidatus Dojkabacteria bacterium]|nr:adenylyltransferase/cytidyltransferase family protein [Candidatus Dojkabacteria bacterium]